MVDVPVPPFSGRDEAWRFHHLFLLHLSQLKRSGDPVGIHQFLLGQALGVHEPGYDRPVACVECAQPYPCRTMLRVAIVSRFQVPWSPLQLARLLSTSNLWSSTFRADVVRRNSFEWGSEPRFAAIRDAGGGWVVTATERGSTDLRARPGSDREMVDFLADYILLNTYWWVDPSWPPALVDGGREAAEWWGRYGRLPYLEAHIPDGVW